MMISNNGSFLFSSVHNKETRRLQADFSCQSALLQPRYTCRSEDLTPFTCLDVVCSRVSSSALQAIKLS